MLTSLAIMLAVAPVDPPPQQPPAPRPKLICRQGEQELGSHIHTSRICRTAEQWRFEDLRRDQRPATYKVVPGQDDGIPRPTRPPL